MSTVGDEQPLTVVIERSATSAQRDLSVLLRSRRDVCVLASDVDGGVLDRCVAERGPRLAIVGEEVEAGVISRLRTAHPSTGVLVVADAPSLLLGTMLLAMGTACVARTASEEQLVSMLRALGRREVIYRSAGGRSMTRRVIPEGLLTSREREVLACLVRGRSYAQIAGLLHIAPETARTHTNHICAKLGVENKRALVGHWAASEHDTGALTAGEAGVS